MPKSVPKLKVHKDTTIYVLAPTNIVSGGPEALHQMVYYLTKCGYKAVLTYPFEEISHGYEIHESYKKYVDSYIALEDAVDNKENILIFPEGYGLQHFSKFKVIQKAVWFLSVDNYRTYFNKDYPMRQKMKTLMRKMKYTLMSMFNMGFAIRNDATVKLAASFYAYDYLSKFKVNPRLLIEPISLEFIEYYKKCHYSFPAEDDRKNIILYNPKKGDNEFMVGQLRPLLPEYDFVPLRGLTHEEMIELMNTSKVYIDFGTFPGAERIPKEAVVCGLCITTGRNGASNYHGDVPIPERYKFKAYKTDLQQVAVSIRDLIENYSERIGDFDEYRKTVYCLEDNFIKQIKEVFG